MQILSNKNMLHVVRISLILIIYLNIKCKTLIIISNHFHYNN